MVQRFIRRVDGTIRPGRLAVLLVTTIVLAVFGTALVAVTPHLSDSPVVRGIWVLVAVAVLKVPLIVVLWSFIGRNAEWPGRRVAWEGSEVTEILAHLMERAEQADGMRDREHRLAHLSREAWNIADQIGGELKIDALTVALRIDERLMREPSRRGG